MTYVPDTPLLGTLVLRARTNIDEGLGAERALMPDATEYVVGAVAAGLAHGCYGTARQVAKNIIPGRDNDPEALRRHSRNWLGNEQGPLDASPATLPIVDNGDSVAGTEMPANTRFQASNGALYESFEAQIVGTDEIRIRSIAAEGEIGYGASGNLVPGSTLTRVTEVADLDTTWFVDGAPEDGPIGGGADQETHDELADRVELAAQSPPQAGTRADIEQWAREASSGVGAAWALSWVSGPGTVTVFVTRKDPDNPIPDAPLRETVQAYLDERIGLHSDGVVNVAELVADTLTPTIALKPNTTAAQQAVYAAMREIIAMRRQPGDGTWYFDVTWLDEAISLAVGEEGHTLVSPAADFTPAVGHLVVLCPFESVIFTTKA